MTDRILFAQTHFGERAVGVLGQKDRIIAETSLSTGFVGDAALAYPVEEVLTVVIDKGENGPEPGAAHTVAHELLEKPGAIRGVGRPLPCKSRGTNAGPSIERIDLEAGIIRQRRKTSCFEKGLRLFDGIALERRCVFNDVGDSRKVGRGNDFDAEVVQTPAELSYLSIIARGKNQFHQVRKSLAETARDMSI